MLIPLDRGSAPSAAVLTPLISAVQGSEPVLYYPHFCGSTNNNGRRKAFEEKDVGNVAGRPFRGGFHTGGLRRRRRRRARSATAGGAKRAGRGRGGGRERRAKISNSRRSNKSRKMKVVAKSKKKTTIKGCANRSG